MLLTSREIRGLSPKGHIEDGESILDAAEREIFEESGIKGLEFIRKLGVYQRYRISKDGIGDDTSELKTIHLFLFSTDVKDLKPMDPKNPQALWVEKVKVANLLTHKKDKEFFLKIVKKI